MKAKRITRKLLERHAAEQDPLLRVAFRDLMRPVDQGGSLIAKQILIVEYMPIRKKSEIIRTAAPPRSKGFTILKAVGSDALASLLFPLPALSQYQFSITELKLLTSFTPTSTIFCQLPLLTLEQTTYFC